MDLEHSAKHIRDRTFRELRGRLAGERRIVYQGFISHGPCTTRFLANAIALGILTVRPRATELLQAGLIELVGRTNREGVYRALSVREAADRVENARRPQQMQML